MKNRPERRVHDVEKQHETRLRHQRAYKRRVREEKQAGTYQKKARGAPTQYPQAVVQVPVPGWGARPRRDESAGGER